MTGKVALKLNSLMTLLVLGVVGAALAIGGISILLLGSIHSDYRIMSERSRHSQEFYKISSSVQNLAWNLFSFMETRDSSLQESFLTGLADTEALFDSYLAEKMRHGFAKSEEFAYLDRLLDALVKIEAISEEVFPVARVDPGYISARRAELSKELQEVQRAGNAIETLHRAQIEAINKGTTRKAELISFLYILVGLAGLAAIFFFHRLSTQRLVRPIQHLAEASLAIAKGNFSTQVETGAVAELGQLQEAFNLMAAKLEEYRQRVESFSENLEKEVERRTLDLEEANRQLQESQYHLSQAERLAVLGEIAAEIAHEINNPLDGIKDCAEMLAEDENPLSLEEREKYVQLMKGGLRKIERVMRQLLDFSREPVPQSKKWVNLNDVVEEALALTRYRTSGSSVQVIKDLSADVPPVWGDPSALQQVLVNLVLNGIDATEESGGALTLTTRPLEDGWVQLQVIDTGKGIPEENREKIFAPFFTTKRPRKGTGLGLAITARIIRNHRGKITVQSQPGKGSCFTIQLPTGQAWE